MEVIAHVIKRKPITIQIIPSMENDSNTVVASRYNKVKNCTDTNMMDLGDGIITLSPGW